MMPPPVYTSLIDVNCSARMLIDLQYVGMTTRVTSEVSGLDP